MSCKMQKFSFDLPDIAITRMQSQSVLCGETLPPIVSRIFIVLFAVSLLQFIVCSFISLGNGTHETCTKLSFPVFQVAGGL